MDPSEVRGMRAILASEPIATNHMNFIMYGILFETNHFFLSIFMKVFLTKMVTKYKNNV
jgi:hypothetical protein